MQRTSVYFDSDFLAKVDAFVELKKYKSRNELIEKSLAFFMEYNEHEMTGDFLSNEIKSIIDKNINQSEKRLGNRFTKLLFEIAIQLRIQQQIFTKLNAGITDKNVSVYRKKAIEEIQSYPTVFSYDKLEK